jgi:sorting nexin-41/42
MTWDDALEDIDLGSRTQAQAPEHAQDADSDWEFLDEQLDAPETPILDPSRRSYDAESDEENEAAERGELIPRSKPGGYDSRIEQMLYENPDLPILITDAGKSTETGGRFIVYTIKTAVSCSSDALWARHD